MSIFNVTIDGITTQAPRGSTVLDVARQVGIEIPTLCFDDRVEAYGGCGLCVVEIEGIPKLLRACSTNIADHMVVHTNSENIYKNRKTTLELYFSDHVGDCRPPCMLACPGQTDCQGYVGLIANGEFEESYKLIKEKIPFPSSIGRVCPHPCEDACRRKMVEEPIAIASLKQFAGDTIKHQVNHLKELIPTESSKHVVVIGGGPGGLSAAYFLRLKGHTVTVLEAQSKMGGMLQYGIPEYRLPKDILHQEISLIEEMGVNFVYNTKLGTDVTLRQLKEQYDAVVIAIGAWISMPMSCPGDDLPGVLGGIDFLRQVESDKTPIFKGKNVAIIGGGNTAMDCSRTAVRLGANHVYNIYRRTKHEMPAELFEIEEAEEEGVIFRNLTNPIKILGSDTVEALHLQHMELGEEDASGRRRPVPIKGKEETLPVDIVIVAIGQKADLSAVTELDLTRWGTIIADEDSYATSVAGVFAVGDATNQGTDIAITAIGEAKKAVESIHSYLLGEDIKIPSKFLSLTEKTKEDLAGFDKKPRYHRSHREALVRSKDFKEVSFGYREEQAIAEANRCLECGCMDYFECSLIKYGVMYDINPSIYKGKVNHREKKNDHPYIKRDNDKCIQCGLCVRFCDEVAGVAAIGLAERGFETYVTPALYEPLKDTECLACGGCVSVCPTGSLVEATFLKKQVPIKEERIAGTCDLCDAYCSLDIRIKGKQVVRNLPKGDRGVLCQKGRFGYKGEENADLIVNSFEMLDVSKEDEDKLVLKIKEEFHKR